jgi:putative ATP-dependent endonuclease of the OLD family
MQIRRLSIDRFRGVEKTEIVPGRRTVLVGPNNAAKSTIVEALDLVLHPGWGRPRPAPDELDYYARDPTRGFSVEVVLGDLDDAFLAEVHDHLEGWNAAARTIDPAPDADGCEPVVRVRATGSPDFDLTHEFAKQESQGARFGPRLRRQVGWLYDGRSRDPGWQMAFHRGGVLDRMFDGADLGSALDHVRTGLRQGAQGFTTDASVAGVIDLLAQDLDDLGVLEVAGRPEFELGGVSEREMLQTLRLALPALPQITIPLRRQGRGVQRLLLVAALLRLASQKDAPSPIGAFEEPEEALEPLRQTQIAKMITDVSERGGQVFVVTHSAEIARAFGVDDLHLVSSQPRGATVSLRDKLSGRAKQGYERRLDGPVVRALFARVPVLVEGPGDRAFFTVLWDHLAAASTIDARHTLSLDFINCEGAPQQPETARLLCEAGKTVIGWAEADVPKELARLRAGGHCARIIVFPGAADRHNLEALIAADCSLAALAAGMTAIAEARGYPWLEQRDDLLSRCEGPLSENLGNALKGTGDVAAFFSELPEVSARRLARAALAAGGVAPFEMKGARPARLIAEAIVATDGVPVSFATVMAGLHEWIGLGCPPGADELTMA